LRRSFPIGGATDHSTDLRHSKAALSVAASDIDGLRIRSYCVRTLAENRASTALFVLLFRLPLPQALFLLGFPCSLLAAELAQLHRTLVTPRFAAHSRPPFSRALVSVSRQVSGGINTKASQISTISAVGLPRERAAAGGCHRWKGGARTLAWRFGDEVGAKFLAVVRRPGFAEWEKPSA
jgi:hypothetical protein